MSPGVSRRADRAAPAMSGIQGALRGVRSGNQALLDAESLERKIIGGRHQLGRELTCISTDGVDCSPSLARYLGGLVRGHEDDAPIRAIDRPILHITREDVICQPLVSLNVLSWHNRGRLLKSTWRLGVYVSLLRLLLLLSAPSR